MTAHRLLALPEGSFRLTLPDSMVETLEIFYPSVVICDEDEPASVVLAIETMEQGWRLSRDGESESEHAAPIEALLALEYLVETALVKLNRRLMALHAGCVATPTGACVVAGDPDQGKTSSTFQLLELGHAFLSEEITLADPSDGTAHPYPQTLSVGRPFLEDFQRHFRVEHGDLYDLHPEFVRYVPHRPATEPSRIETILVPCFSRHAETALEELSADDLLAEFLGYCFEPNIDAEPFFDQVIELLERCRLLRLTYGSAEDARAALADLFPAQARSGR